jgi:hypothetical protein
MSSTKSIKLVDRNNKPLGLFTISSTDTVEALKKLLVKDCESIRKRNIGIERIRLTIGDGRGPALQDKKKTIGEYCNTQ